MYIRRLYEIETEISLRYAQHVDKKCLQIQMSVRIPPSALEIWLARIHLETTAVIVPLAMNCQGLFASVSECRCFKTVVVELLTNLMNVVEIPVFQYDFIFAIKFILFHSLGLKYLFVLQWHLKVLYAKIQHR